MRIGLIRRGFSATGGAEAYLLRLAQGLSGAGHEPVLVTSGHWPDAAWPFGKIIRLPGGTPSVFAAAFLKVRDQFDVSLSLERTPGCDVYRAGDGVHAAWLRRRARFEPAWRTFLRRWQPKHGALLLLERRVFESARGIIANSQMVATEITENFDVPAGRIRVIPNGISTAIPRIDRQEARQRLHVPERAFCALFVGSGWERKGLVTALEAIERLPGENLLLVAGRGRPPRHAGSHTRFLGPTSDLSTLFSAADVFVLPTHYDPFSNACLEALAAGLPVLTTTANGFSEILTPGLQGDITEPGNARDLAAALSRWKAHDRTNTSAECRKLAACFSIQRNAAATLHVLEDVLAGNPAHRIGPP